VSPFTSASTSTQPGPTPTPSSAGSPTASVGHELAGNWGKPGALDVTTDLAVAAGGSVSVANWSRHEIVTFGATGTLLRRSMVEGSA
jgi:hypothetical protein